jgi:hypothetical protein
VNAAGNSSVTSYYSFADNTIAQNNNYYRLKQVDADGKFQYSKVILIRNQTGNDAFRVISNPFTNTIDMDFGKPQSGKADIKLLDAAGRELYHTTGDISGQSRMRINLAEKYISVGVYLLLVKTDRDQFIRRVLKQ